jgi:hypothetical protein
LREVGASLRRIDADLGHLLRLALDDRRHRELGLARFEDYVRDRLGLCPRTAWSLIAIDRAAERSCGEFTAAFRDGRLSHLAARMLLPVLGSRHAAAWIERASAVTLRRLQQEVSWALDRHDENFEPPAPPPLDHDVKADAPDAIEILGQAAAEFADAAAASEDGRLQMRAACAGVTLRFEVAPELAALADDVMRAVRRGSEPRGAAFLRMVAMAVLEWNRAPRHRDPVFERDGWRCVVPGCSSRRNLQDHHVLFRSQGGGNARDNRVSVCAGHHLHGIHTGRIRVRGRAPSDLLWDMPFGRLRGDRYVERCDG